MMNILPSEHAALVATIDPDSYTSDDETPVTSDWVDMKNFNQLLAICLTGDMAASTGALLKLEQAKANASGTVDASSAKDIAGKSATALDGDDDNVQVLINLRGDEMDTENDFRWARLSATITDTASPDAAEADFCAVLLGFGPRYSPANDFDLASVVEIVN